MQHRLDTEQHTGYDQAHQHYSIHGGQVPTEWIVHTGHATEQRSEVPVGGSSGPGGGAGRGPSGPAGRGPRTSGRGKGCAVLVAALLVAPLLAGYTAHVVLR